MCIMENILGKKQAGKELKEIIIGFHQHGVYKAYKQNDVVKALNGMTIEIVHTDAEGRMVLADTLLIFAAH